MTNKHFAAGFACIALLTFLADGPTVAIVFMFILAGVSLFVQPEKAQ